VEQGGIVGGWGTWVINLDRAADRRERIAARMQRIGWPWQRLEAVDARTLSAVQRSALDAPGYRRRHGMEPLPGELGCYLSHVAALRAFLASGARFGLVLEDDANVRDTLPAVLAALARVPDRWDMVKLSGVHSGTPAAVAALTGPESGGHALAVMFTKCTGSSAYAVNRRAAERYLAGLLPMQLPYDHVYDQGWRFGLKVRAVAPWPVLHDDHVPSTIAAAPGPSRKFAAWRRLPAHGHRVGVELRRLAYAARERLREGTAPHPAAPTARR
jgi:glycosyl transferase family 25